MTDISLQQDIIAELKSFLQNHGIMMLWKQEFSELSVYRQELPLKDEEDDKMQCNYILVMIGDQDADEEQWDTEIHFSICIEDRDEDRSGDINVLYLMNEIYNHFIQKGIVGKDGKMEKKAHKRLNTQALFPYYEGDLITHWKLPLPKEVGLEELI